MLYWLHARQRVTFPPALLCMYGIQTSWIQMRMYSCQSLYFEGQDKTTWTQSCQRFLRVNFLKTGSLRPDGLCPRVLALSCLYNCSRPYSECRHWAERILWHLACEFNKSFDWRVPWWLSLWESNKNIRARVWINDGFPTRTHGPRCFKTSLTLTWGNFVAHWLRD